MPSTEVFVFTDESSAAMLKVCGRVLLSAVAAPRSEEDAGPSALALPLATGPPLEEERAVAVLAVSEGVEEDATALAASTGAPPGGDNGDSCGEEPKSVFATTDSTAMFKQIYCSSGSYMSVGDDRLYVGVSPRGDGGQLCSDTSSHDICRLFRRSWAVDSLLVCVLYAPDGRNLQPPFVNQKNHGRHIVNDPQLCENTSPVLRRKDARRIFSKHMLFTLPEHHKFFTKKCTTPHNRVRDNIKMCSLNLF